MTTTDAVPPPEKKPKRPSSLPAFAERYLAPPPPKSGRTIGVDCHPDSFCVAVFSGSNLPNARRDLSRSFQGLPAFLQWAQTHCTEHDIFVMEAGSNSFELCERLGGLKRRTVVLESAFVSRCAKRYTDNDRLAAIRIAKVFLAGQARAVWVPDPTTRERREVLHTYNSAVRAHVAATNSLKSFLNQSGVRTAKRALHLVYNQQEILGLHPWTPVQRELLTDLFACVVFAYQNRQRLERLIASIIAQEPLMLRCMQLLGIGKINAFALLAIIGDVRRFAKPACLIAYLGLNPGLKSSGTSKRFKTGVGKHGRRDLRALLIQAAHAVMNYGRGSALHSWGWKLMCKKGHRNIAVAAVARKLVVQVWYLLSGKPAEPTEEESTLKVKLLRLLRELGEEMRAALQLPGTLAESVDFLYEKHLKSSPAASS